MSSHPKLLPPRHWIRGGLLAILLMTSCQAPPDVAKSPVTSAPPPQATTRERFPTELPPATDTPDPTPTEFIAATSTPGTPPSPPQDAERGDTWQSPLDQMTLVFVPAGSFRMGTLADFVAAQPDELPQRSVELTDYWIDQTEITWEMYTRCERDGGCRAISEGKPSWAGEDHPVIMVGWQDAADYCRWAGRRLPTEAEWEKASRGTDGRRYPWEWIGAPISRGEVRLNFCDASCPYAFRTDVIEDGYPRTAPVGSYPAGASPYGALDMSGNVWEWTADWYAADRYKDSSADLSQGPEEGSVRVIRGGSWLETAWEGVVITSRSANRHWSNPNFSRPDLGFRCALSAD